jgi:uroporphyrinogen decarboxylase
MNERERFRRVFRGEPVDRLPRLEEGVRDEVIELWHAQGLPEGRTHMDVFGLTPHENVCPDLTFDGDCVGGVMSLSPRGYHRAFRASRRRFPDDWRRTARRLAKRDHIACIWAYRGFFQALGVEGWPSFRQVLRAVVRNPADVRARLEMYGDFCARMLEMALEDVQPEFIYLSEPISDNRGPLISPAMYRDFAVPALKRIAAAAVAGRCERILVSTYGNTALLFPLMMEAGVNMLWISEAAEVPEVDYRCLRRALGPELGLIGGVPLSLLRSGDPESISARLEEIVAPLLQAGRYIPLAGGRIREDISWPVYRHYRRWLESH